MLTIRNANKGASPTDFAEPLVSGDKRMVELIGDVLQHVPNEALRLFTAKSPEELFRIRPDGMAAHQLWADAIRLPVSSAQKQTERQFKDKVGRQIAALADMLLERRTGTWRVVGARVSEGHRMRWTRQPTGLDRRAVEKMDPNQGENEIRQLTKAVEVQDPVLILEVAFAEVTGTKPVDQAWRMEGRQNSQYFHWIQDGAKVSMTPPRERKARDLAIEIVCDMLGVKPEVEEPSLSEDQKARALKLLELGLSPSEVAGAIGGSVEQVGKLKLPAKKG